MNFNNLPDEKQDNGIPDKKSYYSILPAKIRYDKNLTANAKVLYSEITALTNEKGYCWASNNYFAQLYDVTPQAVSKWIKELENHKYVSIKYIREGKLIKQRRVSINIDTYQQMIQGVSINNSEGINKSLKRILNNNNKVNTKKGFFLNLIPDNTDNSFIEAWKEWIDYRTEKKKGITEKTAKQQIKFLLEQPKPVEIINQSIQNGWIGLFKTGDKQNASAKNYQYQQPREQEFKVIG